MYATQILKVKKNDLDKKYNKMLTQNWVGTEIDEGVTLVDLQVKEIGNDMIQFNVIFDVPVQWDQANLYDWIHDNFVIQE